MADIMIYLKDNPHSSTETLSTIVDKSVSRTKNYLQAMVELECVIAEGGNRNRLLKTFGNHVLLRTTDAKALAVVRNKTINGKKRELLRLSNGVRTSSQLLEGMTGEWNEEQIVARNDFFASNVIRLWSTDNL